MRIKISTRLVFLIGKKVYKFPISRRGYLQCKNEKQIWDKYKNLNVLGEIYWEKFGIVCMKRYYNIDYIKSINVINVKESIPELNIDRCDLFNYKNWACDEYCNIKLIDYGINEYISKLYKL